MESGLEEFDRPSPVSVLDAPFDISPGSTISKHGMHLSKKNLKIKTSTNFVNHAKLWYFVYM